MWVGNGAGNVQFLLPCDVEAVLDGLIFGIGFGAILLIIWSKGYVRIHSVIIVPVVIFSFCFITIPNCVTVRSRNIANLEIINKEKMLDRDFDLRIVTDGDKLYCQYLDCSEWFTSSEVEK